MKVSIVIPSFNGAKKLPFLLESLTNQSYDANEIVVVLDGSTDPSKEVLRKWKSILPLKILEQENKGRAGARNRATEVEGDIIIFYDDDMKPDINSVENHVNRLKADDSCIVAGQAIEERRNNNEFSQFKFWLTQQWVDKLGAEPRYLDENNFFLSAANMSLKKETFLKLHGFDPKLTDAEDFDFAARAVSSNIKILFDPKNKAYHSSFDSIRDYIDRQRQYIKAHKKLINYRSEVEFSSLMANYQTPDNQWKKYFYYFVPGYLPKMIDKGYLNFLPQKSRFFLYERIVAAFSLYYPNRTI